MEHKLIRTNRGALSNMDKEALAKRRSEKKKVSELKDLKDRVAALEAIVKELREQNG